VFAEVRTAMPSAVLWVVGDGRERPALVGELRELGVESATRLLGVRTDVANVLAAADLLLMTSDTEGTPGVVLEAALAGLPTVTTDVGGVSECVSDGVTGLLVAPDDEAGLAAATVRLLRDAPARDAMGAAAEAWVGERFDFEHVVDEYLDFYGEVLGP
jgi:glycosyltransferase involved in cell wall biosynthesis